MGVRHNLSYNHFTYESPETYRCVAGCLRLTTTLVSAAARSSIHFAPHSRGHLRRTNSIRQFRLLRNIESTAHRVISSQKILQQARHRQPVTALAYLDLPGPL